MARSTDLLELAARLCSRDPSVAPTRVADAVKKLARIAATLNTLNERDANEGEDERRHRAGKSALARANEIAKDFRLRAAWSHDPRGYALRLLGEGWRGNTWGGDEAGYGI